MYPQRIFTLYSGGECRLGANVGPPGNNMSNCFVIEPIELDKFVLILLIVKIN